MKKEGYDFKKEWPKLKAELVKVSRDAVTLAKKGEEEVRRFSQKSKLHIDAGALKLKQEHLCHQIGKEYMKSRCPAEPTEQLRKLIAEWKKIEKEIKVLSRKIKTAV